MDFKRLGSAIHFAASHDLVSLMKSLRNNPHQDSTIHGMIADELESLHPESPLPELIRKQFGLGVHKEPQNNLWYEPVENSWDGTFPYTADIGKSGPFNLRLAHESPPFSGVGFADGGNSGYGPNSRWVVHAISTLPGSEDTGYSFEFPHEEAHLISRAFPAAEAHVDSRDESESNDPRLLPQHSREREAEIFNNLMDNQERYRG